MLLFALRHHKCRHPNVAGPFPDLITVPFLPTLRATHFVLRTFGTFSRVYGFRDSLHASQLASHRTRDSSIIHSPEITPCRPMAIIDDFSLSDPLVIPLTVVIATLWSVLEVVSMVPSVPVIHVISFPFDLPASTTVSSYAGRQLCELKNFVLCHSKNVSCCSFCRLSPSLSSDMIDLAPCQGE